MTYTTDAIILTYTKYREYDRFYRVYTRDFGKLSLLARGSNKIKSKLAGHLEPAFCSRLMIATGKHFEILAQARIITCFTKVHTTPFKIRTAMTLLEAIDKLTDENQDDGEIFTLLYEALARLERVPVSSSDRQDTLEGKASCEHLLYHYFLHLLIHLGHAPDLRDVAVLKPLLVAGIVKNDILVTDEMRKYILDYLQNALDEKRLNSFIPT